MNTSTKLYVIHLYFLFLKLKVTKWRIAFHFILNHTILFGCGINVPDIVRKNVKISGPRVLQLNDMLLVRLWILFKIRGQTLWKKLEKSPYFEHSFTLKWKKFGRYLVFNKSNSCYRGVFFSNNYIQSKCYWILI